MTAGRRYLLISPCRDEARYLRRTLDSVAAQTVPPALWIVVDDGSTDETPLILEEYSRRLPYLRVVKRTDRGRRNVGPGVVEAFSAADWAERVRAETAATQFMTGPASTKTKRRQADLFA